MIGGDDTGNDVIALGTCFSMFVYIRKSDSSVDGEPQEIGGGIQIPET